jgi:3-oxoacyl-[acyl-carrier protein] reductase
MDHFGLVDVVVNNAGILRDRFFHKMSLDEWDAVMKVHLYGGFYVSRAAAPHFKAQESGNFIHMTSTSGLVGNFCQANYAAAKAGVAGMTRALAQEIGSRGITVNCVAPGFIDTDMTRALASEHTSAMLARIPLGRFGDVSEVAAAVGFLCSPQAAYITGSTLHVNGGLYMS